MSDVRFEVGGHLYGLPAADIVEIVPAIALRVVPGAPPAVAGAFCYRGDEVVVVDLERLLAGVPAAPRFSTRILIVSASPRNGDPRLVGLLAEQVLEVGEATEGTRLSPDVLAHILAQTDGLDV